MKRAVLLVVVLAVLAASFYLVSRMRKVTEPVAIANGHEITAADFQERYKQYLSTTGQRDNILLRKRILDNMINEYLIYDDIHRQGIDRARDVVDALQTIQEETLALRYAKRRAFDSLVVTQNDLANEFRRYKVKVHARYLYAKTKEGAEKLRTRLEHGETFESLAREVFRDPGLAGNGGDLGVFGWGDMEQPLEDAAYTLPIGAISEPIRLKIGWAIVRVERRIDTQPLASETEFVNAEEKLGNAIVKRRLLNFAQSASDSIVSALAPSFNEVAVNMALAYFKTAYGKDQHVSATEEPPAFSGDSLVLMTCRGGMHWTLKDFFGKLGHTTEHERRYLRSADELKQYAIGLAAREIIVRRAREEGLDHDTAVEKQTRRMTDEYLLQRWSASVSDTVGQHGWDTTVLLQYYRENLSQFGEPPQVDVAEILVRTKAEADVIRREVDRGANFAALARRKSIRIWAAERGGDLGFGTKENYGVLGDTFMNARVGATIGPAFVDPYYGVFRILARKEGRSKSFEEARDDVIAGAAVLRKQEVLRQSVAALRSKAKVTVNSTVLEDINVK